MNIRPFLPSFQFFSIGLSCLIAIFTWVFVHHWRNRNYSGDRPQWIILYACSLQAIWGFSFIFFPRSSIAAWAGFTWIPDPVLGFFFIVSSAMSYWALLHYKSIAWLLPQQTLMLTAAIGCASVIILGHYADGAEYPRIFILRDQLPEILTAVWHTAAIINRERLRSQRFTYDSPRECKSSY